jgi:hypothetical protein
VAIKMNNKKNLLKIMNSKPYVKMVFLFLIMTIFSLLISSCTKSPTDINVYTGTQGVTVQFTTNNPPAQIYEGSVVMLMAEIWNKGAFSPDTKSSQKTPPVYITVNVDDVYFKLNDGNYQDNTLSVYLEGKSQVWPMGEKTIVPVGKLNVSEIPGTRESPTTKIEVSACYPYVTYFSESICVDTDIYNLETNPICKNQKTFTYPAGQGAPIIISGIDVDMIPVGVETNNVPISQPVLDTNGQIQAIGHGTIAGKDIIIQPNFRIYFKNTDQGVILAYEEGQNPCLTGPASRGEVIKINASLGNTVLECTKPEIQMYSNEGSVRCYLPASKVSSQFELNRNYELPLRVEAEYFYKTTTVKDVQIIRVS